MTLAATQLADVEQARGPESMRPDHWLGEEAEQREDCVPRRDDGLIHRVSRVIAGLEVRIGGARPPRS